jgi:hypothetical protein
MPNNENAIAGPIINPKGIAKYHLKSKWKSITIAGRINKVADCDKPRRMTSAALSFFTSFGVVNNELACFILKVLLKVIELTINKKMPNSHSL